MKNLFGLLLLAVCCSCSTVPSAEDVKDQDHGPVPVAYESKVKDALELSLKDPRSAEFKFLAPYKSFLHRQGILVDKSQRGTVYGWSVPVLVNAKNSYGGFTGFERYTFVFRDGQLIAWQDSRGLWTYPAAR